MIIDAYVWQEALHVKWTYDPLCIGPESLQQLANSFITHLKALITHCMTVDSTEYTRSDFDLVDLDDDQFDRLADILGSL